MKNFNITTTFKNLMPLTTYSYRVETLRANWPAVASPASGTFIPMQTSGSIDTLITFCPSSGACSAQQVLPYSSQICSTNNVPFVELRLSLDLPYTNQKIYGPSHRFDCEECLDTHSIDLSTNKDGDKPTSISARVLGLVKNNTYSYNISSLGGSYALNISATSGTFVAKDDNYTIVSDIAFCCAGECGATAFVKTNNSSKNNDLNHTINFRVRDLCSNNIAEDALKIVYNKPEPSIAVSNNLVLNNVTKNCGKINAVLNNIIPNNAYTYQYKIIDSNWPVYLNNISGTLVSPVSSGNISSEIVFCSSAVSCEGERNVLSSTKISDNRLYGSCGNDDYYATLYIEASGNCYASTPYITSDPITVYCRDCITSPAVKIIT